MYNWPVKEEAGTMFITPFVCLIFLTDVGHRSVDYGPMSKGEKSQYTGLLLHPVYSGL